MEWEKPELHDLANDKKQLSAQGQCTNGSGDTSSCATGPGAQNSCVSGGGAQGTCAGGSGQF